MTLIMSGIEQVLNECYPLLDLFDLLILDLLCTMYYD